MSNSSPLTVPYTIYTPPPYSSQISGSDLAILESNANLLRDRNTLEMIQELYAIQHPRTKQLNQEESILAAQLINDLPFIRAESGQINLSTPQPEEFSNYVEMILINNKRRAQIEDDLSNARINMVDWMFVFTPEIQQKLDALARALNFNVLPEEQTLFDYYMLQDFLKSTYTFDLDEPNSQRGQQQWIEAFNAFIDHDYDTLYNNLQQIQDNFIQYNFLFDQHVLNLIFRLSRQQGFHTSFPYNVLNINRVLERYLNAASTNINRSNFAQYILNQITNGY